jgi:hypothetical protein
MVTLPVADHGLDSSSSPHLAADHFGDSADLAAIQTLNLSR